MNSNQSNVVHLGRRQSPQAPEARALPLGEEHVLPLTDTELFVVRIKSLGVILQDSHSQEPFNPGLIAGVCYSFVDGAPGDLSWTLVLKDGTRLPATATNGGASVVAALNVLRDLRMAETLLSGKPQGA